MNEVSCPVCNYPSVKSAACPNCGTDLSVLKMVESLEPVSPAIAVKTPLSRQRLILIIVGAALLGMAFELGALSFFNPLQVHLHNYSTAPLTQAKAQVKEQLIQAQQTIQELQAQAKEKEHIYRVKPGDSLEKISESIYGTLDGTKLILDANPRLKSNPDKIYSGELLDLPLTKNEQTARRNKK